MFMRLLLFCLVFVSIEDQVLGKDSHEDDVDLGEPLLLTPLLEEHKVDEAQEMARVRPDVANTTSYSGYFTVNKECESNLFFWFFPAQNNWTKAPLILWVQGGPRPRASSLDSLFEHVGPLTYVENVGRRQYSWNVENNLLFVDQPVGTGYSYTGKGCYAQNETAVGKDFYSAVVQFLQLFPELQENRFYLAGYSYSGHFIPALGHTIHKNNPTAKVKINLSGMMIGNGWMDALHQRNIGSYLYQLGLLDKEGRDTYSTWQEKISHQIKNEKWKEACESYDFILGDLFKELVGNVSLSNYLKDDLTLSRPYENFVQEPEIRKAIHVGNRSFSFINEKVVTNLGVDFVVSVKPWIEELLEHYFIVFYNGQLDIRCSYPTTIDLLKALEWSGEGHYKNATRQKWCVEGLQAGFYKGTHRLYDVLVRNAGHSVPYDQPLWGYILANSITSGPTDNPLHALDSC